jgi:hypothetical protein
MGYTDDEDDSTLRRLREDRGAGSRVTIYGGSISRMTMSLVILSV